MALDIPHVKELIKELNKWVKGELILIKKRDLGKGEWLHLDRTVPTDSLEEELEEELEEKILETFPSQLMSYDISNQDESFFGTVYITTYEVNGLERVGSIRYAGKIPGYKNEFGGDSANMEATEDPYPITAPQLDIPEFDLTRKNNTLEEPLYRHDVERLMFADHEIDGVGREAYFRKLQMKNKRKKLFFLNKL